MVQVTVKWYNPKKGFGFVRPDDGNPDAFLHVSAVDACGLDRLPEGARLECTLLEGPKGWEVQSIESVLSVPETTPLPAPDMIADGVRGVVKFFNAYKGFGFVTREGDDADVFVHVRTLEQCGLFQLTEGQTVAMEVSTGSKGLQVDRIAVVAEPERPSGPLLRWRPAYAVGDEATDTEHRELIALVNALHDRWAAGANREDLGRHFDRVISAAVIHLTREDNRGAVGPGEPLSSGRWRWLKDIVEFRERSLGGPRLPRFTDDMAEFLRAWATAHILAEAGSQPRVVGAQT